MSGKQPDYLTFALRYHGYGANVLAVGSDKRPTHPYTDPPNDYKQRRQTADEVENLIATATGASAWLSCQGVGIISGIGGWRCIDFDAPKGGANPIPFDVVDTFCQRLGLDTSTYTWLERSGSGRGWHVWLRSNDELPELPGVKWGSLLPSKDYAGTFDHCELRWTKCMTVVAPSLGGAYQWHNAEPTEAPPEFAFAEVLYALTGVVDIPEQGNDDTPANRSTLNESTVGGELENATTGEVWSTLEDYKRDEQQAKDLARERFDLVSYIQRHLGTTWTQQQRNGELRIGQPGANYGGWFVTADGRTWNTFQSVDGKTGGDCYALVAYCEFGTTRVVEQDKWRRVLAIVESETGVRFPTYERKRARAVVGVGVVGGEGENAKIGKTTARRSSKTTTAELVLERLSGLRFRRNELSRIVEWQPLDGETWHELNDDQLAKWRIDFQVETGQHVTRELYTDCIISVTETYDPIHEYFDALPKWDGETDHVQQLATLANADEPDVFTEHLRRWMIGTYATGYYGAIVQRTVNELFLVLHGDQGTGKTTFLTTLIPQPLRPYLYAGKVGNDKDGKMAQAGSFVILNDELAGLRKTEVEEIKSILSTTQYRYRAPYDSIVRGHKRRVSFCGTTNEDQFLTDHTGSRRFLVHSIRRIDFDALRTFDVAPVWAQVREQHERGVPHWFNASEVAILNERNKRFATDSYADSLLRRYFTPGDQADTHSRFYMASEIAQRIAELYDQEHSVTENRGVGGDVTVRDGTTRPNPERLTVQLNQALRKQGYTRKQYRGKHPTPRYGYWVVERSKTDRENAQREVVERATDVVSNAPVGLLQPTTPTTNEDDWPTF